MLKYSKRIFAVFYI